MEKTLEQIDEEMRQLSLERIAKEDQTINETIYGMFAVMTKEEVLAKIGEMMAESPTLKGEVKRLLIDTLQTQESIG